MARGMVAGERITSQAATDEYRANHERALGEKQPGQRGRWVYDPQTKTLVRAEDYRAPPVKCGTSIMADRVHEGVTFDDGTGVKDIGSRAKRRAFLRETGLAEASDFSPGYHERQRKAVETQHDRGVDTAFDAAARKLYNERKLRD